MAPKLYVTCAHKFDEHSLKIAEKCSEILGVPFIHRNRQSLEQIQAEVGDAGFLVVSKKGQLTLKYKSEEFFFHPSMSKVRIKGLRKGNNDPMLMAMDAKEGDRVLDCTLGLGSDAIVASFAVGGIGSVTGIESEPVIALIVSMGMENYVDTSRVMNEIIGRVKVVNANSYQYLKCQQDNSFDIVYFDPMFRKPLHRSSSMEPMRSWVNPDPLQVEVIKEAVRVASKTVVLKESHDSVEFQRLGFLEVVGGKHSPIAYGVIRV